MTRLDKLLVRSFGKNRLRLAIKIFLEYMCRGSTLWYMVEGEKEYRECLELYISLQGTYETDAVLISDILNGEFYTIKHKL